MCHNEISQDNDDWSSSAEFYHFKFCIQGVQVDLEVVGLKHNPGTVRHRYGTGTVQVRYRYGTGTIQVRYRYGTGTVQVRYRYGTVRYGTVRYRYGTGTVQVRYRYGTGTVQVRYNFSSFSDVNKKIMPKT